MAALKDMDVGGCWGRQGKEKEEKVLRNRWEAKYSVLAASGTCHLLLDRRGFLREPWRTESARN